MNIIFMIRDGKANLQKVSSIYESGLKRAALSRNKDSQCCGWQ